MPPDKGGGAPPLEAPTTTNTKPPEAAFPSLPHGGQTWANCTADAPRRGGWPRLSAAVVIRGHAAATSRR